MRSGKLKVAVIGVGNIGSVHASAIYSGRISGMTLGALCDIDPARRAVLAGSYPGVPVYADPEALLSDASKAGIDAVIISVPHPFHAAVAVSALEAGLHVMCEKPADVESSRAVRMKEAAEKSGRLIGIMFNQRTDPLFRKAKEIIDSGELGGFKRSSWIITNWYRTQAYYDSGSWRATWNGEGGGVMLNQAPHNIDIWLWLLGLPERIRAFCREGRYHRISVEDEATVYAEFSGGGSGVFVTSTGEAPGLNRLEMAFDKGRLILENGKLNVLRLGVSEREFCFSSRDNFALPPMSSEEFCARPERDGHELILENFAEAVRKGVPLIASIDDGIRELEFSNAAFLSSWTDNWSALPLTRSDRDTFSELLKNKREAELADSKKQCGAEKAPADPSRDHNASDRPEKTSDKYSERWKTRW